MFRGYNRPKKAIFLVPHLLGGLPVIQDKESYIKKVKGLVAYYHQFSEK